MVPHEGISHEADRVNSKVIPEQVLIDLPVVVVHEHCLAMVPPLSDMVRHAGDHDTSNPGHRP
jgi:hypothetical protein